MLKVLAIILAPTGRSFSLSCETRQPVPRPPVPRQPVPRPLQAPVSVTRPATVRHATHRSRRGIARAAEPCTRGVSAGRACTVPQREGTRQPVPRQPHAPVSVTRQPHAPVSVTRPATVRHATHRSRCGIARATEPCTRGVSAGRACTVPQREGVGRPSGAGEPGGRAWRHPHRRATAMLAPAPRHPFARTRRYG